MIKISHCLTICASILLITISTNAFEIKMAPSGGEEIITKAKVYSRGESSNLQYVTYVDLVHFGPKQYYNDIGNFISQEVVEKGPALLLTEKIYCSDSFFEIDPTKFVPELLPRTAKSLSAREIYSFISSSQFKDQYFEILNSKISQMRDSGMLKRVACPDNGVPSSVALYREKRCEEAKRYGISCQPDHLTEPKPNMEYKSGDVDISKSSPVMQVMAALIFASAGNPESRLAKYFDNTAVGNLNSAAVWTYFAMNYRNKQLEKNLLEAISAGHKHIILPWGLDHHDAMANILDEYGFKQLEVEEISFSTCYDINKIGMRGYEHLKEKCNQ